MTSVQTRNKLTAFALFAGGGGLHLGLERAGFKVTLATDVSAYAEKTNRLNWPKMPFIRDDIRKLSGHQLLAAANNVKPDLIAGGPPCQGFSTLGAKLSGDPRNQLFSEFARIVEELDPRFILLENVKALTTLYGGRFCTHILDTFERLGYAMNWRILDAADFGVPQFRKRVFFFGSKHNANFSFPKPSHGPAAGVPHSTTWKAIADLAGRGEEIPNHIALVHSPIVVARYKLIPEGGRLPPPENLPKQIRRSNFGNTYKRLHRKRPALTMVPGNNAFPVHPTLHRSLTPREAARLQSFPDSFVFAGDRRNQCILVGNAVPPDLAKVVGQAIIKHSEDAKTKISSADREPTPIVLRNISEHHQFIDLFCGAGGITIGLSRAGWSPLLGMDLNRYAGATHTKNFPNVPYKEADLSQIQIISDLKTQFARGGVALIAGGPPCQGFSIFGNRRFINTRGYDPHEDERNKLVFAFVEAVKQLQPRWFIMENVPGLVNLNGGAVLRSLLSDFVEAGYSQCEARILNAADYGVPQLRRRLLIIGNRTGHIIPWPKRKFFAQPRDWQLPYRTVGEVISDLASQESQERYSCHMPMKHKPLLVERYRYIPEGGRLNVDALPPHLRVGYRTNEVKNYSHVFKRLHRDRPAFTMVPGHNAFPIHPWLDRALTVREAARIQTFPDGVEFEGPRQEQCIQVGNAFPPLLAEIIGNNIMKAEMNEWFPGRVNASAYYALVERTTSDQLSLTLDGDELEAVA